MLILYGLWSIEGPGVRIWSFKLNYMVEHEIMLLQLNDESHLRDDLVVMRLNMLTGVNGVIGRPSWSPWKYEALLVFTWVTVIYESWCFAFRIPFHSFAPLYILGVIPPLCVCFGVMCSFLGYKQAGRWVVALVLKNGVDDILHFQFYVF